MILMNKKGDTIPFQWIFIGIGGVFIIFIFTMFISSGIESSQVKLDTNVLLHFNTIFSTLATSEMTQAPIKLNRGTELRFMCEIVDEQEKLVVSDFQISGGKADRSLNHMIAYSNEKIYGTQLFTKTENIALPFTVSSALYVSDSSTRYILYYNYISTDAPGNEKRRQKMEEIKKLLPNNSSVVITHDFSEGGYRAFEKLVIITLNGGQLAIDNDERSSVSTNRGFVPDYFRNAEQLVHVNIIPDEDEEIYSKGVVQFKRLNPEAQRLQFETTSNRVNYINRGMLAGALLSPSKEFYDCNFIKTLDHIQIMALVLAEKADSLEQNPRLNQCSTTYSTMKNELDDYAEKIGSVTDISGLGVFEFENFIDNIENYNRRLDLNSCPLIY